MIFVTTGTQEPFDRLIRAIDQIAYSLPDVTFKVQAFKSQYKASNVEVLDFVTPEEFNSYIKNARLIVSHAGMGTIISAMVSNKPIIVMPRLLKYKEHRNEHQLATAKKLDSLGYVHVAYDEQELINKVLSMWSNKLQTLHNIGSVASADLIDSLRNFIKE